MYQLVREKFPNKQVITIEDPVEIKQEQMLQLQLNSDIGMTYDELIKLSLRHRPDILIIGEIRDSETARAVIRASLTGAVVFSTFMRRASLAFTHVFWNWGLVSKNWKIVCVPLFINA